MSSYAPASRLATDDRLDRFNRPVTDLGSSSLSSPPPPPADRPKPGDDTRALLGDDMSTGGGVGASTPGGQLMSAVAALMHGANGYQSVVPGDPRLPQLIQLITSIANDAPQTITSLQQTVPPHQLLASIGRSGADMGMGQMGVAASIPQPMGGPGPGQ